MSNNNDVNIDNVVVEDANEMAQTFLANLPKEPIPEGVKFDGITCVDCGFEIEPARLKAVPTTCRCSECIVYFNKDQRMKQLAGNPTSSGEFED